MRHGALLGALLAAACAPPREPVARAFWIGELVEAARAGRRIGGIDPRRLAVPSGEPLPFRGPPAEPAAVSAGVTDALVVLPAFKDGGTAAYYVPEAWDEHPLPWVQAEYVVRTPSVANPIARVFSVGPDSTFYSPFWEELWVTAPEGADPQEFTSSTAVLSRKLPMRRARLFLYPIIPPAGIELGGPSGAVRPYSLQPVAGALQFLKAWVHGTEVTFIVNIPERFTMHDGVPDETRLYDFVTEGSEPLTLPAVLAADARTQALARRVKVHLFSQARVFLPAGWEALAQPLAVQGFPATGIGHPDIEGRVAAEHALKVAADASCFQRPDTFPRGCRWLDSEAALRAERRLQLEPTGTLLTVTELDLAP